MIIIASFYKKYNVKRACFFDSLSQFYHRIFMEYAESRLLSTDKKAGVPKRTGNARFFLHPAESPITIPPNELMFYS